MPTEGHGVYCVCFLMWERADKRWEAVVQICGHQVDVRSSPERPQQIGDGGGQGPLILTTWSQRLSRSASLLR